MPTSRSEFFDPIEWIDENVELSESNAADFWFDHMASQCSILPVIYVPFDGHQRGDFVDRGQILDFAAVASHGRVLDFGPGDGWPSLLLAPMVEEVVGVDGSRRRVEVCTNNARRLGLANARFVHVAPGQALPFAAESFDGVVASSSLEQTPDLKATLAELHRVLKPGGRLRVHYESLSFYQNGNEREMAIEGAHGWEGSESPSRLLIFDRHIAEEYTRHYGLVLDCPPCEIKRMIGGDGQPSYAALTLTALKQLSTHLIDATTWTTRHPSCQTWLQWLGEVGFTSAQATYDGGWFARKLFEKFDESHRPREIEAIDEMLRPLVEIVCTMPRPSGAIPGEWEPWITATK